jgi:hypothetical protein
MKTYQKPVVEIESIISEAVADVETIVSFKDVDIWGGLFGTQD